MLGETTTTLPSLLTADEPPACEIVNADSERSLLLLCDHACARIPAALNNLGLGEGRLREHIAYDIGVADVSRTLSKRLDATLVLANYSRLVVDINRYPDDPTLMAQVSDNVTIPGNEKLSEDDRSERIRLLFEPYHAAVRSRLRKILERDATPTIISIHSFTPVFGGHERPWHIGVLWHRDDSLAAPLLAKLRARPELCVGDNEPYSALDPVGYTMRAHAEPAPYPHALLEIRQDLIDDPAGVSEWATLLGDIIADLTAARG